ncbi:TOTE conflict system archaeo-eukaryotic primase domain-containing protein [Fontibacillus panacisegetis]
MESYDRLFPNQDTLPKGGFGKNQTQKFSKKPQALGRNPLRLRFLSY